MNKLVVHTGVYTPNQLLEVLGSITMTPSEMSNLGRSLRPNIDQDLRQVFTNSDHVLNGIRLSMKEGNLQPDDVLVLFHSPEQVVKLITIDKNGMLSDNPEGFFTQIEHDLIQLF